jgi:hypothetical protein
MNSQPESNAVPIASNFDAEELIRTCAFGASGERAPEIFSPDWHPQLGARLSGFPRFVPLRFRETGTQDELLCWPDFATFLDEPESRQMMYYPAEESAISVRIAFSGEESRWRVFVYLDAELVGVTERSGFLVAARRKPDASHKEELDSSQISGRGVIWHRLQE